MESAIKIVWVAVAFLLGSIPFGVVIAKTFKGIDPRKAGSGNPGSTNVARLCGLPYGVMTLACDVLKGTLPVWASLHISPDPWFHTAVALAAVLGHMKSVFLGFKGGKGVATTIGVLIPLGIMPLLCAVACCLVVIGVSSYVSLGSLVLVASLGVWYFLFGMLDMLPLTIILMLLVVWAHRDNIRRLLRGEEKSWRKKKSG